MTVKASRTVKASSLEPGDVIRLQHAGAEYSDATVYRVDDAQVHVWRPYVHTGDVLYSHGRVIPYLGLEDFPIYKSTHVELLRKGNPLK